MMKCFLVTMLSISLALAGCATTHTIPLAQHSGETVPLLKSGDVVRVFMKSGKVRRMKVQSVDAQTLTGKSLDHATAGSSIQIALADAQSMQVRRISGWRTGAAVVGVVAAIAVVAGGIFAALCRNGNCSD